MSVSRIPPAPLLLRMLAALLLLLATSFCYAKGPEPPLRIPLSSLGFEPPGARALAAGGAMSTVQFIDEQHLLVTFVVHRLMKRLPDDPPYDQDRLIEAVIVHLPSGKVLARTEWRVHDTGQYLWNLGHGRFLLRSRDTLTTFAPLANLANHDPFVEQPLIKSMRMVMVVLLSPDRDLLTVETIDRPVTLDDAGVLQSGAASRRAQLNFYRLVQPVQTVDRMILQSAGVGASSEPINISLTSAGFIEVIQESHDRWIFDFNPYVGKYVALSPFDTTCRPQPHFVSASEFVAFGCRGNEDQSTIGGFNLHGEQMWQQNLSDAAAYPTFAMAPGAGRFALSRNVVSSGSGMTADFAPPVVTSQEIRVYQMHNGRQLLRVEASPVQRMGGNYDLSADGLRLAVLRGDAIEVDSLPPPTVADEAAIRKEKGFQPEDAKAFVNLAFHGKPSATASTSVNVATMPPSAILPPSPQAPADDVPSLGDPVPNAMPRKPPTLYTLPTDKPEDKPQ